MRQSNSIEIAPSFPILDTLRAVGALAVLTTHTSFQTGEYLGNGVGGTLLARLDVGVAIFFVLSGFLLSRPHLVRAALDIAPPGVGRYYEKRLLRIMPVYLITVAIALSVVPGNSPGNVTQWISSALLADSFWLTTLPHGLTHMWSVAVEASFYLILPLLMVPIQTGRRGRRLAAVILMMIAVSLWWHVSLATEVGRVVPGAAGLWLPGYLTWFACGIGLAWLHVRMQSHGSREVTRIATLFRQPGAVWSIVLGLMLLVSTPLAGPTLLTAGTESQSLVKHVVYALVGLLVVGTGVFAAPGRSYERAMSWPPFRHVGHISYSIFCIHLVVLSLAFELLGIKPFTGSGLLVWLVTMALTLVLAEVLYALVEMPALRVKDRLRRAEPPPASASGAPEATTTSNAGQA